MVKEKIMKSDYEIFNSLIVDAILNFKKEKEFFEPSDFRAMSQVFIESFLRVECNLIKGYDNAEIEKKKQAIFQLIESQIYG